MIPASINSLYEKLTEEDKNLVLDYLQFLVSRGNIKKVKKNENLFSDIDAILNLIQHRINEQSNQKRREQSNRKHVKVFYL